MSQHGGQPWEPGARLDDVLAERGALTNLAYRLLGSLTEAEDAVQEAYARWFALAPGSRSAIVSPGAWLTTVTSRICLDMLGSARVRRERYVGEWLPEPVPDRTEWPGHVTADAPVDPADRITLDESVDMAFLVVLEAMTPAERVCFLLHDVFRYSFTEVAEMVGRSPGACRQLASSARRRLEQERHRAVPEQRRTALVREFKQAWQDADVAALVRLLDPEAAAVADGGGRASASPVPIEGGRQVAGYLAELAVRAGSLDLRERTVNGQPGLVAVLGTELLAVYSFEFRDDRIDRIWVVRNPDKLRAWAGLELG
ncbi:RNA polymerase sigma factor SigJ [Nocardioides sp. CER19]|uniref:RNA polymerase sigma factor SigJ n=1 Tax=Nocardioides sp. CER19 TaxID=3038538 RepID=UPI002446E712|nr:RNA polymerase sigma factor SigJ [Nocardioides sp. CER19]MDH2416266.1 RNA polymerase sigma factor SigJ [Nocardioides sp. CER19]